MSKKQIVAKYFRKGLEPIAKERFPNFYEAKMCGLCAIASFSLHLLFKELGIDSSFVIGTFYSNKDLMGFIDHSFVVSEGTIIDITSDQFGLEPVTFANIKDSRYTIESYGRKAVKELNSWPLDQKPTKQITQLLLYKFESDYMI